MPAVACYAVSMIGSSCVPFALVLTLTFGIVTAGQERRVTESDVRAARKALQQLRNEFQATLDFAEVPAELFASSFVSANLDEGPVRESLELGDDLRRDPELLRRALVSHLNLLFLSATSVLCNNDLRTDRDDTAFPEDVEQALGLSPHARRWLGLEQGTALPLIRDRLELEEVVRGVDRVSAAFRRLLPVRPFRSATYRRNLRTLDRSLAPNVRSFSPESVDGSDSAKIQIVVLSGGLMQVFVNEDGRMRLVTIRIIEM